MRQLNCYLGKRGCIYLLPFFLLFTSCGQNSDSNVALGSLIRERVVLTATANEIVTALPFKKGDRVKKGDLLVQHL